MVSKMEKGIVKWLARFEALGWVNYLRKFLRRATTLNTSVPKKKNTSVRKRSGLRARNLFEEEEESASSQDFEDEVEDEKIEDDYDDDEEDNESYEEHEDEVDDEEDQEEDEEDDGEDDDDDDNDNGNDDTDDDESGNEIGKQISKDEPNSSYVNSKNDLQIVVSSNGNAEEVTKQDIAEDIDKQNEQPVEDLDMDKDAHVKEERFEGAQFEEVLVQENTNEKKDYDDGDGYLIGSVDYTNSIVSGIVGDLHADQ
ncbi:hypothetical protein V2J09_000495 [Rumex salicifolius]